MVARSSNDLASCFRAMSIASRNLAAFKVSLSSSQYASSACPPRLPAVLARGIRATEPYRHLRKVPTKVPTVRHSEELACKASKLGPLYRGYLGRTPPFGRSILNSPCHTLLHRISLFRGNRVRGNCYSWSEWLAVIARLRFTAETAERASSRGMVRRRMPAPR